MKRYRVNEIFYSLQGEGAFTGTPVVFVRFSGCNRQCSFCDTDFSTFSLMTAEQIIEAVRRYPARRVVLTGGEPLLHIDIDLFNALKKEGLLLNVETNGTLPVLFDFDWVTCSPKDHTPQIQPDKVNEVKIVYTGQPDDVFSHYRKYFGTVSLLYLQPCSGKNIEETINKVLTMPDWRLSLQTHKLINIK